MQKLGNTTFHMYRCFKIIISEEHQYINYLDKLGGKGVG